MICALTSSAARGEIEISCPALPENTPVAFTGALGYGRFARPGANPQTKVVTTLADYHPYTESVISGSLRWAIEEFTGPRIIEFDDELEGVIQLKFGLNITTPYVTINGDTADDGRITIQGEEFGIRNTNNIIIRHLRFRSGELDPQDPKYHCGRSFNIYSDSAVCHDIILDHCSIGPSRDDNLAITGPVCRLTIQNCIIGGGLVNSSKAAIIDGQGGDMASGSMTFCQNLITNTALRQPGIYYRGRFDLFNNAIGVSGKSIELGSGGTHAAGPQINIFHNYFRTSDTPFYRLMRDPVTASQQLSGSTADPGRLLVSANSQMIYVDENAFERWLGEDNPCADWENPQYQDQWELTEHIEFLEDNDNFESSMRRSTMWTMPNDGADLNMDPEDVKDLVLQEAGCTPLDDYDQALVAAFCTGESLYPDGGTGTDTFPGHASSPTPAHDQLFIAPVPPPQTLSWSASDETETYLIQARPLGSQNWNIYVGTTSSTSISCSGVFSTNKSYEWRVISRNSCHENGYLPSSTPVWRFITCSGSPCP